MSISLLEKINLRQDINSDLEGHIIDFICSGIRKNKQEIKKFLKINFLSFMLENVEFAMKIYLIDNYEFEFVGEKEDLIKIKIKIRKILDKRNKT